MNCIVPYKKLHNSIVAQAAVMAMKLVLSDPSVPKYTKLHTKSGNRMHSSAKAASACLSMLGYCFCAQKRLQPSLPGESNWVL